MKKIFVKILLLLLVFVVSTFVGVFIIMNSSNVLTIFTIKSVEHNYNNFEVKFDRVKAAVKYKIEILNDDGDIVYSVFTTDTDNKFILDNLEYNMSYSLMVYAYDSLGDYKPAKDAYVFVFNDPLFSGSNSLDLNNSEYNLQIDGDLSSNDYYLLIKRDDNILENNIIKSNTYSINLDYYKDMNTVLDLELICNGITIDNLSLYNGINPIGDIHITSPSNNTSLVYDDVILTYDGGDNASNYKINLYHDNDLISSTDTLKKKAKFSSSLFMGGSNYRIEVIASNGSYFKSDSVSFTMTNKIKMQPVYISNNPKYIKAGTKITLASPSEDATIYYTLNGDDPLTDGILYTGPITIDSNVILKCVATGDLKENSIIKEYDINVGNKSILSVYISPSNQGLNEGVHSTGFTTEKNEMNDIANYVVERLKSYGVIVYRNNPSGNINQWNKDANYLGVDMKLAIHSNASAKHTAYGTETWIDTENSETYSLANLIQNSITDLYPYKDRIGYNRGVKYANGEIGEANDSYVRFGMLVEVAYHDDYQDALFIMQNKKNIGYAMADAILKYYQII